MTDNNSDSIGAQELDANMPAHPYRAAIEAGAKVLRRFRDTNLDLYTDSEIVWLVYCTMQAEAPKRRQTTVETKSEGSQ